MRKALLLLVLLILLAGCRTVEYVPVVPEVDIPSLEAVYPERPELLEVPDGTPVHENININQERLMGYILKLENYADDLNDYIAKINEALQKMRDIKE